MYLVRLLLLSKLTGNSWHLHPSFDLTRYYVVSTEFLDVAGVKTELDKDLRYCSDLFTRPAPTANTFHEVFSDTEGEVESERYFDRL